VIPITVSKISPIFGVQSNETNQHGRFLFARESAFLTTNAAKNKESMHQRRQKSRGEPDLSAAECSWLPRMGRMASKEV
jgi:hypothetical protein